MKKIGIITLLLAVAIGVVAIAQDTSTPVTGRVTAVDTTAGTFTVDTPSGPVTYSAGSSTTYMAGGQTKYISDIKVGDQVRVSGSGSGTTRIPTRVEIMGTTATDTGTTGSTGTYNSGTNTGTTTGTTTGGYNSGTTSGTNGNPPSNRYNSGTTTGSTTGGYNSGTTTGSTTGGYNSGTTTGSATGGSNSGTATGSRGTGTTSGTYYSGTTGTAAGSATGSTGTTGTYGNTGSTYTGTGSRTTGSMAGRRGTPVTGRITMIDPAAETMTVVTMGGETIVYKVNTDSKLTSNGQTTTIDQMQVGNRVRVYHTGTGANQTATSVEMLGTGSTNPDETNSMNSTTTSRGRLPKTASQAPMIGLFGVVLLLSFSAMRMSRRYRY